MITPEALAETDAGIRGVVLALNEAGFETTDSGDGTKVGMDCAVDFPMVAGLLAPAYSSMHLVDFESNASLIARVCEQVTGEPWTCEISYSTKDTRWIFVAYPQNEKPSVL